MARAHYVKTSRKEHRCHRGHVIPAGEAYYWAAPGFRSSRYGKKFACTRHPFRASQLTTGLRSEALSAAEAFEDALDEIAPHDPAALDDIQAAREQYATDIEGYVQQREEALDAWENGNSQLEEYLETAQAALDEIESWEPEEWYGDTDARDRGLEGSDDDDDEQAAAEWEAHVEQQIDAARALVDLEF